MNQIIRVIGIAFGVMILTTVLLLIIPPILGYISGYLQHKNECNQLKGFIDMESKKWTSQLLPIVLNKAIDKYNQECL